MRNIMAAETSLIPAAMITFDPVSLRQAQIAPFTIHIHASTIN